MEGCKLQSIFPLKERLKYIICEISHFFVLIIS